MRRFGLTLSAILVLAVGAEASMTYECSFDATGGWLIHGTYVKVSADSKAEATQKARAKIKDLRGKNATIKYIRCK